MILGDQLQRDHRIASLIFREESSSARRPMQARTRVCAVGLIVSIIAPFALEEPPLDSAAMIPAASGGPRTDWRCDRAAVDSDAKCNWRQGLHKTWASAGESPSSALGYHSAIA
jgi:hypothetical protein